MHPTQRYIKGDLQWPTHLTFEMFTTHLQIILLNENKMKKTTGNQHSKTTDIFLCMFIFQKLLKNLGINSYINDNMDQMIINSTVIIILT